MLQPTACLHRYFFDAWPDTVAICVGPGSGQLYISGHHAEQWHSEQGMYCKVSAWSHHLEWSSRGYLIEQELSIQKIAKTFLFDKRLLQFLQKIVMCFTCDSQVMFQNTCESRNPCVSHVTCFVYLKFHMWNFTSHVKNTWKVTCEISHKICILFIDEYNISDIYEYLTSWILYISVRRRTMMLQVVLQSHQIRFLWAPIWNRPRRYQAKGWWTMNQVRPTRPHRILILGTLIWNTQTWPHHCSTRLNQLTKWASSSASGSRCQSVVLPMCSSLKKCRI